MVLMEWNVFLSENLGPKVTLWLLPLESIWHVALFMSWFDFGPKVETSKHKREALFPFWMLSEYIQSVRSLTKSCLLINNKSSSGTGRPISKAAALGSLLSLHMYASIRSHYTYRCWNMTGEVKETWWVERLVRICLQCQGNQTVQSEGCWITVWLWHSCACYGKRNSQS